jgi:hypothetical protein
MESGANVKTNAVTIYHNPSCGTSRNTLAMIRAVGGHWGIALLRRAHPQGNWANGRRDPCSGLMRRERHFD